MCMTPVRFSFALRSSLSPGDGQDSPAIVLLLPEAATPGWIKTDTRGLQVGKPVQGGFLSTLGLLQKRAQSKEG